MLTDILSKMVITEYIHTINMYTGENVTSKRLNRGCWGIAIKYEGETEYISNGRKLISNKNNIVILPKGSDYEWRCVSAGHCIMIEFDSDSVCDRLFGFHINNAEKLLNMFRELEYGQSLKSQTLSLNCLRDCYSVLLCVMESINPHYITSDKQEKISNAVEYIIKNYNTNISNDELAEMSGMSTVYFRKLFRELQGESPKAFAKRLKINRAKEMLKSDYSSIGDIASSLGYTSIYDFSRDFKKHTGMSPTEYARVTFRA